MAAKAEGPVFATSVVQSMLGQPDVFSKKVIVACSGRRVSVESVTSSSDGCGKDLRRQFQATVAVDSPTEGTTQCVVPFEAKLKVSRPLNLEIFKPVWSKEHKTEAVNLIKVMAELFRKANIQYFAAYGTLLGALRHQGLIPWDDDIDVAISELAEAKFLELTKAFEEQGIGVCQFYGGYKIYWLKNPMTLNIEGFPHSWPFVDIFLFKNITKRFHEKRTPGILITGGVPWIRNISHLDFLSNKKVFPLSEISFEGISISAPNNPEAVVECLYGSSGLTHGVASHWNHRLEADTGYDQRPVLVSELKRFFEERAWAWTPVKS